MLTMAESHSQAGPRAGILRERSPNLPSSVHHTTPSSNAISTLLTMRSRSLHFDILTEDATIGNFLARDKEIEDMALIELPTEMKEEEKYDLNCLANYNRDSNDKGETLDEFNNTVEENEQEAQDNHLENKAAEIRDSGFVSHDDD